MRFFLKYWGPVFAWIGFICLASGDLMSAAHTSRFLIPFFRWLKPDISTELVMQIHFLVRKCAHLTEYAVFAVLLWRAGRSTWPALGPTSLCFIVLAASACMAALDEFHQSFVPSRGAAVGDVLIDTCGALVAVIIPVLLHRRGQRRRRLRVAR